MQNKNVNIEVTNTCKQDNAKKKPKPLVLLDLLYGLHLGASVSISSFMDIKPILHTTSLIISRLLNFYLMILFI